MLADIVEVEAIGPHTLRLEFSDGGVGTVDVKALVPFEGVFEALQDPEYFARATVDTELGTVTWPDGEDLDPVSLYAQALGKNVDEILAIATDSSSKTPHTGPEHPADSQSD